MNRTEQHLAAATCALPETIAASMLIALKRSELRIGAFAYETELLVCPLAVAARTAGVWHDGWPAFGGPLWGGEDGPTAAMEEFAAWFDICAQERGLDEAVAIVRAALAARRTGCLEASVYACLPA